MDQATICHLVEHLKRPIRTAKIKNIESVKVPPNDMLISYFLADNPLGTDELAKVLRNQRELYKVLQQYDRETGRKNMPKNPHFLEDDPIEVIGDLINGDRFAMGYDEDNLIVASKLPRIFRFPSGVEAPYALLVDEMVANVSILHAGYARLNPDAVFIRQNFLTMMQALYQVQRDHPKLRRYNGHRDQWTQMIPGIIIAHERTELNLWKNEEEELRKMRKLEIELMAEQGAKEFLEKNGVDPEYYEMYHLMISAKTISLLNVSAVIVEKGFNPMD